MILKYAIIKLQILKCAILKVNILKVGKIIYLIIYNKNMNQDLKDMNKDKYKIKTFFNSLF